MSKIGNLWVSNRVISPQNVAMRNHARGFHKKLVSAKVWNTNSTLAYLIILQKKMQMHNITFCDHASETELELLHW